jgi:hypothetical protein
MATLVPSARAVSFLILFKEVFLFLYDSSYHYVRKANTTKCLTVDTAKLWGAAEALGVRRFPREGAVSCGDKFAEGLSLAVAGCVSFNGDKVWRLRQRRSRDKVMRQAECLTWQLNS